MQSFQFQLRWQWFESYFGGQSSRELLYGYSTVCYSCRVQVGNIMEPILLRPEPGASNTAGVGGSDRGHGKAYVKV